MTHNIVCWIVATIDCQEYLGLLGLGMMWRSAHLDKPVSHWTETQSFQMLLMSQLEGSDKQVGNYKILNCSSFLDREQDNYTACPRCEIVKVCLWVKTSFIWTLLDALRDILRFSSSSDAQFRDQKTKNGGCAPYFAQRFLYKPQCLLEVQSSPWKDTCHFTASVC